MHWIDPTLQWESQAYYTYMENVQGTCTNRDIGDAFSWIQDDLYLQQLIHGTSDNQALVGFCTPKYYTHTLALYVCMKLHTQMQRDIHNTHTQTCTILLSIIKQHVMSHEKFVFLDKRPWTLYVPSSAFLSFRIANSRCRSECIKFQEVICNLSISFTVFYSQKNYVVVIP